MAHPRRLRPLAPIAYHARTHRGVSLSGDGAVGEPPARVRRATHAHSHALPAILADPRGRVGAAESAHDLARVRGVSGGGRECVSAGAPGGCGPPAPSGSRKLSPRHSAARGKSHPVGPTHDPATGAGPPHRARIGDIEHAHVPLSPSGRAGQTSARSGACTPAPPSPVCECGGARRHPVHGAAARSGASRPNPTGLSLCLHRR